MRMMTDYKTDGRPPLTRPWHDIWRLPDLLGLRKGSNMTDVDAKSVRTRTSELPRKKNELWPKMEAAMLRTNWYATEITDLTDVGLTDVIGGP